MTAATDAYQLAFGELTTAKAEVETIVETIRKGNDALRDWKTANIIDPNYHWPQNEQSRRTQTLHAGEWPTGQAIAQAIHKFHSKKTTLIQLWSAIPEANRVGLQPPDKFI